MAEDAPTGQAMSEYTPPYTGLPPRVTQGKQGKDEKDGYTSFTAGIERQAKKTPGPGLYVQHPDWTNKAKKAMGKYTSEPSFSWTGKGQRSNMATGPKNVPGPGLYKPRLIKGKFSTAPKKFCFAVSDNSIPGPGKYTVPFYKTEENLHMSAPLMAESAKKTSSRELIKKVAPGPGEYKPTHTLLEKRETGGTWGRREQLQKVVAKRYTDIVADAKRAVPDPGKYPLIKLDKISRGAKWSQVHGVARSAIHGTY